MTARLTPELVRAGYLRGWFPMADEKGRIDWWEPKTRALLPISGIKVSKSLARTIRSNRFEIVYDGDFEAVMRGCLRPSGNWINEEMIEVYTEIFRLGWAHCVETRREGRLVGGVYGLAIGRCFCAESMFHVETDASKVALWAMVERRRSQGDELFDAQMMSPHLTSLGAFEITQTEFLVKLRSCTEPTWPSPIGSGPEAV